MIALMDANFLEGWGKIKRSTGRFPSATGRSSIFLEMFAAVVLGARCGEEYL